MMTVRFDFGKNEEAVSILKTFHTKYNVLRRALVELERETRPLPYAEPPPPMTLEAWLGLMMLCGIILACAVDVLR